jgi:hypothetical protein
MDLLRIGNRLTSQWTFVYCFFYVVMNQSSCEEFCYLIFFVKGFTMPLVIMFLAIFPFHFFVGYIAGLSVFFIPFPYLFCLAIIHNCTFDDLFGIMMLPLHLGVLCGLWTNIKLIKKYSYKALLIPLGLLIGILLGWKLIYYFVYVIRST